MQKILLECKLTRTKFPGQPNTSQTSQFSFGGTTGKFRSYLTTLQARL